MQSKRPSKQKAAPLIAYKWFLSFVQGIVDSGAYTWMAKLVAVGELLIGIALILGLFTAAAAFFSGFMVWNFALAGSAGVAPMFLLISVLACCCLAYRRSVGFGPLPF